jgi:hypothetical protein
MPVLGPFIPEERALIVALPYRTRYLSREILYASFDRRRLTAAIDFIKNQTCLT